MCNFADSIDQPESIYFGLGFVNNKVDLTLSLEEIRRQNYKRNQIESKLVPKFS